MRAWMSDLSKLKLEQRRGRRHVAPRSPQLAADQRGDQLQRLERSLLRLERINVQTLAMLQKLVNAVKKHDEGAKLMPTQTRDHQCADHRRRRLLPGLGLRALHPREQWNARECRVERNVTRILELLADKQVKATFFTLGWIAERYPQLVRRIVAGGTSWPAMATATSAPAT